MTFILLWTKFQPEMISLKEIFIQSIPQKIHIHHLNTSIFTVLVQKWKIVERNPTFNILHSIQLWTHTISISILNFHQNLSRIVLVGIESESDSSWSFWMSRSTFSVQRSTTLLLFENQITRHGESSFQVHYDLSSVRIVCYKISREILVPSI